MMDASELAALRAALVMRLEVLRTTSETTADNRRPVELDQTSVGRLSRMDAMQVQAMALATERRRHDEARRVGAAICRIDKGEYGYNHPGGGQPAMIATGYFCSQLLGLSPNTPSAFSTAAHR